MIGKSIEILLSAYRRDDYTDAVGFVSQLGVVFEGYPESVIEAVTSPRTGLQRRCKFPPSIAEVVDACEAEAGAQHRSKQLSVLPKFQNPYIERGRSIGEKLCAKYGIRAIPVGWDAVDVVRFAHQYGSDFPKIVEEKLKVRTDSEEVGAWKKLKMHSPTTALSDELPDPRFG